MGREKEFWLEPNSPVGDLSRERLRELSDAARPDVIILSEPFPIQGTRVASHSPGGDILITYNPEHASESKKFAKSTAVEVTIRSQRDEQRVLETLAVEPDYLIADCPDWKIIPLENLIAKHSGRNGSARTRLIARTRNYQESRTALGTLELGVDGIVLQSQDIEEAKKTRRLVSASDVSEISLSKATIESVKPIQTGARVCVDTTELIGSEEGLLVGCSSQALFLIEAEVHTNPHVSPRPFRVNAGPVSLYVLAPEGKTRYLSDLQAGETVLVVGRDGRSRSVDVARVKVERRPLVLVQALSGDRIVKTILQNAETVRLVGPGGSIPIHALKPGDEVYVRLEEGGRHFGSLVDNEMIIER